MIIYFILHILMFRKICNGKKVDVKKLQLRKKKNWEHGEGWKITNGQGFT